VAPCSRARLGLPVVGALVTVTSAAARLLGRDDTIGRLARLDADLVV
jgi:imidazolonepropionase-like amidohydrolase